MRVAVIYGGRSVEHEVSVITALQVMMALSKNYDVEPIYISKDNKMYNDKALLNLESYKTFTDNSKKEIAISKDYEGPYFCNVFKPKKKKRFDVAFLCVHGYGVEDGTISAMFEYIDIPYVGGNILSSSLSQDKNMVKKLLKTIKVDVVNGIYLKRNYNELELDKIEYPCIVKPNKLGSSIGIKVCHNKNELKEALNLVFYYDDSILIERFIENKIEYNIALFRNNTELNYSMIESVECKDLFSFDDKYLENKTKKVVPAEIDEKLFYKIRKTAKNIYTFLNCNNIIRIDFIYDLDNNKLYFNEINSIPGSLANYLFKDKYSFSELTKILIENTLNNYNISKSKVRIVNASEVYNTNLNSK